MADRCCRRLQQQRSDFTQVVPPHLRQNEATVFTFKQRDPQMFLERPQLLADRTLREKQLIGSTGTGQVPRRSLEHAQGRHRRKE